MSLQLTDKASGTVIAPAAPVQNWRWLGSRSTLIVGFGVLLILLAAICADALHTLGVFEAADTRIRQEFIYRERTLEQVRTNLYESGDIVRDYLLIETDPQTLQNLRGQIDKLHADTTTNLSACIQSLTADKSAPFEDLASKLDQYWATIGSIFAIDSKEKPDLGNTFQTDLLSQHAEILAITKEIGAVNDDELKEADRDVAAAFVQFRRRLLMAAVFAVAFGLIFAVTTILYAARIEKHAREKYEESLNAQRELKELSRRLVDAGETERRSIARELHDEVGQSLGALLMDVERLKEMSDEEGPFRQDLENIQALAEKCIGEVRDMSLLLRPSMLDDLGLVAALEWQARETFKRTGMLVEMTAENVSDDLPEDVKTCVYRIVQEALNNCVKHAHTTTARVVVRGEPNRLFVTVEDDGKGFDPSRERGMGLLGMSERVNQLGGTLKVESNSAKGTILRVELPLASASAKRQN